MAGESKGGIQKNHKIKIFVRNKQSELLFNDIIMNVLPMEENRLEDRLNFFLYQHNPDDCFPVCLLGSLRNFCNVLFRNPDYYSIDLNEMYTITDYNVLFKGNMKHKKPGTSISNKKLEKKFYRRFDNYEKRLIFRFRDSFKGRLPKKIHGLSDIKKIIMETETSPIVATLSPQYISDSNEIINEGSNPLSHSVILLDYKHEEIFFYDPLIALKNQEIDHRSIVHLREEKFMRYWDYQGSRLGKKANKREICWFEPEVRRGLDAFK